MEPDGPARCRCKSVAPPNHPLHVLHTRIAFRVARVQTRGRRRASGGLLHDDVRLVVHVVQFAGTYDSFARTFA